MTEYWLRLDCRLAGCPIVAVEAAEERLDEVVDEAFEDARRLGGVEVGEAVEEPGVVRFGVDSTHGTIMAAMDGCRHGRRFAMPGPVEPGFVWVITRDLGQDDVGCRFAWRPVGDDPGGCWEKSAGGCGSVRRVGSDGRRESDYNDRDRFNLIGLELGGRERGREREPTQTAETDADSAATRVGGSRIDERPACS